MMPLELKTLRNFYLNLYYSNGALGHKVDGKDS